MTSKKPKDENRLGSRLQETPIAVIGMACLFPGARNAAEFWDNIVNKRDAITDVPSNRWDVNDYYDPDPKAPDKTYCKRGGFLPEIDFDPMEFGMPPNILEVTDVSQMLSLVVAKAALEDARYGDSSDFDRDRIGVVLGVGGGQKLITPLTTRLQYPVWKKILLKSGVPEEDAEIIVEKIRKAYVPWEENSFPGMLGNVIAGRIANRLNLGGTNCVVDAACASSLTALKMAVSELLEYRSDIMLTGGVDTDNSIFMYMCFSKTPAFTDRENSAPFDIDSSGMMVGEGIGMLALKRLGDAERDKDRIYAVIRGIGTSSDGRFSSIYNPRPEGQFKALSRAYEDAGIHPSTVGLVEAHGTGTRAGDPAEVKALKDFFGQENGRKQHIALGSVKSQIGHTKAAAGSAGLIKAVMALHHKILPPTINVKEPNPKFELEASPFYVNTETRPWIHTEDDLPRRAAVSSFGFGGTNFHVVLEEYQKNATGLYRVCRVPHSLLFSAATPDALREECRRVLRELGSEDAEKKHQERVASCRESEIPHDAARVGFVSESLEQTRERLKLALETLEKRGEEESWSLPKGVYYRKSGMDLAGKVVALFSGQGSQYLEMGKAVTCNFPTLLDAHREMDGLFVEDGRTPLSEVVFPRPAFDGDQRKADEEQLRNTEFAQPAIGVLSSGLFKILADAGFEPDFVAGHSFGELTALWAAQVLSDEDFFALARARGRAMAAPEDPGFDAGSMLAVIGDVEAVRKEVDKDPACVVANLNSRQEVVLAGPTEELAALRGRLKEQGYRVVPLPVSAAFHTPLVGHAQKPFAKAIRAAKFRSPRCPVYSNTTGRPYDKDPKAIQKRLAEHILNPVLFKEEIENMYEDGGRLFVEFGPRGILAKLVGNILEGKPHVAVALNASPKRSSDRQLRQAVVELRVAGLPLRDIDPYGAEERIAHGKDRGPATVTLTGSNYVSEKTQKAFQDALNDGHQIADSVSVVPTPEPGRGMEGDVSSQPVSPGPRPATDTARVLESLEKGLDLFFKHQGETLQVHEQYLNHHLEYTRTFYDLMRQQASLVGEGSSVKVTESLERSIAGFHDHQGETLRVHEQYLRSQAEVSKSAIEVLREESSLVTGRDPASIPSPSLSIAVPSSAPVVPKPKTAETPPVRESETAAIPPAREPQPVAAPTPSGPGIGALTESMLQVVSEKTGYPVEMLELDMEMEADLGIDSIKRVEILGTMMDLYPDLPEMNPEELAELKTLGQIVGHMESCLPSGGGSPQAAPAPATPAAAAPAAGGPGIGALTESMLQVVSEKTGYPVEMLELDMEMEADLGIDSIKRVEILGTMMDLYPDLPEMNPEELAELKTLGQIVGHMESCLPSGGGSPQAVPAPATPAAAAPAAGGPGIAALTESMLQVVSEKTGYPVEMLELDMEMEADLGIDSIKRVEILGTMMDLYPDLPEMNPEELAELKTLGQIVGHMESCLPSGGGSPQAAPAPATPAAAAPVAGGPGIAALTESMLQVVSEKTGYPVEMLELDMEMEADLGIDSIKRVEILGTMMDLYPDLPEMNPEELAELKTLGQIVGHMESCLSDVVGVPGPGTRESSPEGEEISQTTEIGSSVPQGLARLERLPAPDTMEFSLPEGHVCLVTDDGTSRTVGLAEALVEKGWKVVVLSFPPSTIPEGPASAWGIPRVELKNLEEKHLKEKLEEIAEKDGPIGGLIHLNPCDGPEVEGEIAFSENARDILLHVFLMAKHLQPSLTQTTPPGRRFFLTVVGLDGSLGVGGGNFSAVDGGFFGLVKTLNLEWESVFCRAVDLLPGLDDAQSISSILQELHDPDVRVVETGYGAQGRVTLVAEPSEANARVEPEGVPDSSAVFVVSGGAKGVTASCVARLAAVYKCKFVLLGRSPLTGDEPEWARGCHDASELKKFGMEAVMAQGEKPTPRKVEEILKPVLANREIESTLRAIRDAGGEAEYLQADVTDPEALKKIGPVVDRLGDLAGLIHGAGVLADRLIEKKTVGDFQSVYSTKVKGLEALLHSLDNSRLKYLVLFSSAAGFFGNPGQSDYSMANEILNKVAYQFKSRHPDCCVRSFNWGPWDGGMVSDSLKKLFEERNVQVIPIEGGTKVFVEGFSRYREDSPQVLVGSSMGAEGGVLPEGLRTFRVSRNLRPDHNPFLQDHVIGGRPVLPAACVMSWMADGCEQFYPGYRFARCEDYRTLKGIAFDKNAAEDYWMEIEEVRKGDSGQIEFGVQVLSRPPRGKAHHHYSGRILLVSGTPEATDCAGFSGDESQGFEGAALYQDGTLFHGPTFRVVERVISLSDRGLKMQCRLPVIGKEGQGQFPARGFNPYAADALFQAMLVWVRRHRDAGSLPSKVATLEHGGSIPMDHAFYVSLEVRNNGRTSLVADVTAHDEAGTVYCRMLGAEVTVSKKLNDQFLRATSR